LRSTNVPCRANEGTGGPDFDFGCGAELAGTFLPVGKIGKVGAEAGTKVVRALTGLFRSSDEVVPKLADGARRRVNNGDYTIGDLDPGVLGSTNARTGEITISSSVSGDLFEETLRHEIVHQRIVRGAVSGPVCRGLYNRSALWTFGEEALAEGIATRSARNGLRFPVAEGYITPGMVAFDAGAFGAAGYGVYEVGSR